VCNQSCTLTNNQGGGSLSNPGTKTEYTNASDSTCTAHTLTCSGVPGTLSCSTGNMNDCQYSSCNLSCGLTGNQGGGSLLSGAPGLTEYASPSDTSCATHTLTCTNGTLYCDGSTNTSNCQYNSCSKACSLTGNQGGGTLTSGNTRTEYVAANDPTCTAYTLTCTNGSLSCSTGGSNLTDCAYASCNKTCGLTGNQGGGSLNSGGTATEYTSRGHRTTLGKLG
jgi:hypothetical protein